MKIADFEAAYCVPAGASLARIRAPIGFPDMVAAVDPDSVFNVEGEYEFMTDEVHLQLEFLAPNNEVVQSIMVPPRVVIDVEDEPLIEEPDILDVLREGGFNAFEIHPGNEDVSRSESIDTEDDRRGAPGK